jgi:hypothetical protein
VEIGGTKPFRDVRAVENPAEESPGYEPPSLRVLGTLTELTRGVTGASDGLGPGSAIP